MRRFAMVLALVMGTGTLFAATPASANGDCGTPNGGTVVLFSRTQYNGPTGPAGRSLVNAGAAGCSLLTYTEDGKDLYGVDTRILQPGANALQARYFADSLRADTVCFGGSIGGCRPLKEVVSATGSVTYDSDYFELPGYPAPFSGRIVACAGDACTVYESADKYQCDEAFVDERESGVLVEARPCTNLGL